MCSGWWGHIGLMMVVGRKQEKVFQPRCAASMCVGSHSVLVQCNIAAALGTAFIFTLVLASTFLFNIGSSDSVQLLQTLSLNLNLVALN